MPMHKCENCETEVCWNGRKQRGKRCVGWVGSLKSKWGKKHDKKGGVAWWCPYKLCQTAKDLACLKKVLPNAGIEIINALMQDLKLQQLNRN